MSSSEQLRRRLEALNRGPLTQPAAADAEREIEGLRRRVRREPRQANARTPQGSSEKPAARVYRRDIPARHPPARSPLPAAGPAVSLDDALDGREVRASDGSCMFLVERDVAEPESGATDLSCRLAAALRDAASGLRRNLEHVGVHEAPALEDLVFVDLETTGLGSCPLFLIGVMVGDETGFKVQQYFARDYSEERAALIAFLDQARQRKLLVSYNGKSFDMPFVTTRAAAHRVPCRFDLDHLDLLHSARRTWRSSLPDCKLQTVERWICGRTREGDIPGAMIPDAYHEYVRTGNAAQMVGVLEHNRHDLVTLAEICVRLPSG